MKKLLLFTCMMLIASPGLVLADGRTDYNAHCAGCHGAHGNVQTEKAKALKVDVRQISLKISTLPRNEVIATIETGRNKMPNFKDSLTKEQIEGIADYVMALRTK